MIFRNACEVLIAKSRNMQRLLQEEIVACATDMLAG
jgi:hypothetical protein